MTGVTVREDESEASLVGAFLSGRWRVLGLLGGGGMSTVYEAEDATGERVAVKVLRDTLARNRRTRERFLREGRLASRLSPSDTAKIIDNSETPDGRPALVMELLSGQTLRKRCNAAGGKLDTDEALRVAERVAEVLAAAHAQGIVHRDVKPENVFLTSDGQVKVLDFGVASLRDEASHAASITQSGAALGTPAFMAPEQARGRRNQVDARTDVWALGATLFYCLTGRYVHEEAASANEALIFAATQRAPPLGKFRPDLRHTLASVVDRALAFDPRDRWETAARLREALAAARHALGTEGGAAQTADTMDTLEESVALAGESRLTQRLPWFIAALAGIAIVAAVLIQSESATSPSLEKQRPSAEVTRALPAPARAAEAPARRDDPPPAPSNAPPLPTTSPPAAETSAKRHRGSALAAGGRPGTEGRPRAEANSSARFPGGDDVPDAVLNRRK